MIETLVILVGVFIGSALATLPAVEKSAKEVKRRVLETYGKEKPL